MLNRERETGNGERAQEKGKSRGQNQRMCNEVTDRARVQVRFCSLFFRLLAPSACSIPITNIPTRPELIPLSFHEVPARITTLPRMKCNSIRRIGLPQAVYNVAWMRFFHVIISPGQPLNKTSNRGASGKILLVRTALKTLFVNIRRLRDGSLYVIPG